MFTFYILCHIFGINESSKAGQHVCNELDSETSMKLQQQVVSHKFRSGL